MSRVKSFIYNPDMLRCMLLFFVTFTMYFEANNYVSPYIRYIILPWAAFLVLKDLFGKRLLLKERTVWSLIALLVLFCIAILLNLEYFNDNFYMFAFYCVFFLVLYPPDITSLHDTEVSRCNSRDNKYRIIFIFCIVFIVPATIITIMSLWSYFTDYSVLINDRWYGYSGFRRLKGFYNNTNIGGLISMLSIAMLTIAWVPLGKMFAKRNMIWIIRAVIAVLIVLQMIMLTLSGSRASRLSLLFFVLLFSGFALYRALSGKIKPAAIRVTAAVSAACLITGAVYLSDGPIRVAMAVLRSSVISERTAVVNTGNETADELLAVDTGEINSNPNEPKKLSVTGRKVDILDDDSRISIWKFGFEMIKREPLFGVSAAALTDAANAAVKEVRSGLPEEERPLSGLTEPISRGGFHNAYIELAVINGVPALIVFLLFLLIYAVKYIRLLFRVPDKDRYFLVCGIFALCATILFWNMFESYLFRFLNYTQVIFWSCLSFAGSLLADGVTDGAADGAAENKKIEAAENK